MKINYKRLSICVSALFTLLFYPANSSFAQALDEVRGTVVSAEDNQPLQGVTVVLKNTTRGTNTNAEGVFVLPMTPQQKSEGTIVFSFTGLLRQEVKINGRSNIKVTLGKDVMVLKDVVVTNSYTKPKRKEEVVGSISTVTAEELQANRPIESIDKMLEGLAAGVHVEQSTELGTPVKINIRGQNSLTNIFGGNDRSPVSTSSQPLYVVDGVPIVEQRRGDEPVQLSNEQLLNPIAGLNPDDIESISVLKDAAAAAIYGANASNGVIIITTKRGKAGKTRLNIGYNTGWSQSINRIKLLNGEQYHDLLKELYLNEGRDPFTAEILAGPRDINSRWFELVNRYSTYQNVDLDLSGGSESTQFRLSGSFLDQQAIQKGNDFQKIYFRIRIDHAITKKLSISGTMAPTITKKNGLNVYSNVPIIPNVPVYNADGSFYQLERLLVPNPLAVLAQNVNTHSGGSFNGNVRIEYAPFTSLRLSSSFGIDGLTNKQNVFNSSKNATGQNAGGLAQIYDRTNFSWISFSQATYTPTLRNGHKADVTMGFEAQSQSTKLLRGSGSGFTYYRLNELSNAQNQTAASSRQNSNSYSVYGQSSYSYKNKYFTTVSGRYDAASIFGPDVNNTVNASIGLGWSINKEKFLSDSRWIDLLRLRGSYGTTGNSRIGSYEAKGLYNFSDAGYNGIVSSSPATAPNPDLTWEKSYKLNVGLDFNFRKRFSFSLDVYQNIVDDAISIIRIPVENGFNEMLDNVAKMRNRGVDGSLQAQVLSGKLSWTSTINFGLNKNVILEVKGKRELFSGSANAAVLKTGISTSAIWGFRFAGIDSQTGNELYYDRDGKVTPASLLNRNMSMAYQLGDRLPTVQGGFINNFSYRGVTLTVNILYSLGAERLIENSIENNGRNLDNSNQSVNLLDRWQRPGDVTHIPRLSRTHPPVPNSTRYLYEDSYLKLSNISVAYALPKAITDRLKGIRLTIFGNGTNLWYWYTSPSPEGRNGIKEYKFGFPEAQSFTGGFRMGI